MINFDQNLMHSRLSLALASQNKRKVLKIKTVAEKRISTFSVG